MEQKETRLARVYKDLKGRITTGQLPPGGRFPSVQGLREEYQIGFRTARQVTQRLREEHLIEVLPRKAPIVCRQENTPAINAGALDVLAAKDSLQPLFDTLADVLPYMLVFISQNFEIKYASHYEQASKAVHRGLKSHEWRLMSFLCRDLFILSGNTLFSDVFTSTISYSHLAFFFESQYYLTKDEMARACIFWDALHGRDPAANYKLLAESFKNTAVLIHDVLESLDEKYPDRNIQPKEGFQWNIFHTRNYLYSNIMKDLIQKISSGVYPPGSYLPHEAELARQYGVSVSTVRKALSELGWIGYCKTLNVKGTIVLRLKPEDTIHVLQNPVYKKEALLYLYALQFMAIILIPAAQRAAPYFTDEEKRMLSARFDEPGALPLGDILRCVIGHLDLEPMQIVLEKLEDLVSWGHYPLFYNNRTKYILQLNRKSQSSLQALINGNAGKFAVELSDCYCIILESVRNHLVHTCRLRTAEDIIIPQVRQYSPWKDSDK